jgi:hypothetical protein
METADDTRKLLGYGQLDLQYGDWFSCNDVASFSFVRHPEQDAKYFVRELMRALGKRFPGTEAQLMWDQIEQYRNHITALFGPPEGAQGKLDFEQAALDWYAEYGLKFEKEWYLAAPFELQYSRVGHERIKGHWLGLLHHDLVYFVEAGFSGWEVIFVLRKLRNRGLFRTLRLLLTASEETKARFWVEVSACLTGFRVTERHVTMALGEIAIHAGRLGFQRGYPVNPVLATLDYFRRLEFGGLGAEAIGL